MTAVLDMAKKQAKPTPQPEPPARVRKPTILAIKGNVAWKEWLERGSKHCRTDVSKLVDIALARYLKEQGFDEPPPER